MYTRETKDKSWLKDVIVKNNDSANHGHNINALDSGRKLVSSSSGGGKWRF